MELYSSLSLINLFTYLIAPLVFLFFLKPFLIHICKTLAGAGNGNGITKAKSKLPPGPWKLPLIGNLHQIVGLPPHLACMAMAKKYGPIIHLQLGEVSTIVVSSAHLAKEALTTCDLALASRPDNLISKILFYGRLDIGFSPYGTYWKQMRKICASELLSASKVESFFSVREEEVRNLVESIRSSSSSSSPINISKKIIALQNTVSCRSMFGTRSKDETALIELIMETAAVGSWFDISDLFPSNKLLHFLFGSSNKLRKMNEKFDKILNDVIKEHEEHKLLGGAEEDLLDVMLRLQESGGLDIPITPNIIKAVTVDLLLGGTETTATVIEWAMAELLRNPRVKEKAQVELRQLAKTKKNNTITERDLKDLSYLKMVLNETLRVHVPAPLLVPRQCREQCEIGGYTIPVNTNFILNAWAIARDPKYWNDVESFQPERFAATCSYNKGTNFEYIPFGAGRRMCPGISFAMVSVEHTLAQLLYHFDWELPNGMKPEDVDMTEMFGGTTRMKNNLFVVATPYSPL